MFFSFLFLFLALSCKENTVAPQVSRLEIADSAVSVFEQKLVKIKADSLLQQTSFNGIVSVSRNGKILYEKTQGFENFQLQKPLTSNSVFAIASISKQFTSALILRLEEQNSLKITAKASDYLPELRKNFPRITIEQLLSHTSGMLDFSPVPLSAPGEKYSYSNKGYFLLGKIAEKAAGKPLKELYKELFNSAGMISAATAYTTPENFASAYLNTGKTSKEVENMPGRLSENFISTSAGGLLMSAPDLHKWNYALHAGKILKPENLQKMRTKRSSSGHYFLGEVDYGLGIMMSKSAPQAFFHSGYVKGSPSLLIFYPKSRTSVVILSNIAEERLGKKDIFRTHLEIKRLCDWLESAKEKG